jgi:S-adenosylmethionine uptake transporter
MVNLKFVKALLWFVASLFMGCLCDVITKYLSPDITSVQINFIRLSVSSLLVFPLVIIQRSSGKRVFNLSSHVLRGVIFAIAICLWGYGLSRSSMLSATVIGFLIPIFVNILAIVSLKESVSTRTWFYMCTSFLGVILVITKGQGWLGFDVHSIVLLFGAFLFAVMDVLNKKYINDDPTVFMLFYPTFFAAIALAIPAILNWKYISVYNFCLISLLGTLGVSLFYCIIRAFSLANVSLLAPARYLEILISVILGYLIFGEKIDLYGCIGSFIVFVSTLIMYKKVD